ncbi:MAG: ClpX C4-type zinc finger protein [Arenimonas sp.]
MSELTPPPIIACARVICFALIDDDVHFTGRCDILVDGKELGPVKRLAICTNPIGNALILLYCDEDWNCLAAAGHATVEKAKATAERAYSGVSSKWQESTSTEADTVVYLAEHFPPCSFCGKRGFEVSNFIEGNHARICTKCIEHFHLILNP